HTSLVLILPHPPVSPLFPYTTLFRSHPRAARGRGGEQVAVDLGGGLAAAHDGDGARLQQVLLAVEVVGAVQDRGGAALPRERLRSEEHTSELQSRFDLVCRLLLEKKK